MTIYYRIIFYNTVDQLTYKAFESFLKQKSSVTGTLFDYSCGEGGIRTHDTVTRIQTFQACSFDHSDTSPDLWA